MARIEFAVAIFLMFGCLISCGDDDNNNITSPITGIEQLVNAN